LRVFFIGGSFLYAARSFDRDEGDRHFNFYKIRDIPEHVAEDVIFALQQLADGDEATAVRSLKRLGDEVRPFAGVARAIVEQRLDLSWESFVHLYV
jgi:hypothetical protein